MEKWLRALERRFGRYAPPNVAAFLIAPKVVCYLWAWLGTGRDPDKVFQVLKQLILVPQLVLEGEVWRLVTFMFVTMSGSGLPHGLLFLVYMAFLYWCTNGVQSRWGPFRLCVYIFTGWLFTVAGSFLALEFDPYHVPLTGIIAVETTLLFAFATFYPDLQIRVYFVLPVKLKWVAAVSAAIGAVEFAKGPWDEMSGYAPRIAILAAAGNYLLFLGPALWRTLRAKQEATSRKRQFDEAMRRGYEERDRMADEDREREENREREGERKG